MTPLEKGIWEKARKLDNLERDYLRITDQSKRPRNGDELLEYGMKLWKIGGEAFNIRNEIKKKFIDNFSISAFDEKVKEILIKIRNDEKFYSISFFENFSESLENSSKEPFSFAINFDQFLEGHYDDWLEDFLDRFYYIRYFEKVMTIGPIISSTKIPNEVRSYFDEVRDAYALGLYVSAIALCRSMMERCFFEKLSKKGYFKNTKKVELNLEREDKLYYMIGCAKRERLIDYHTKELAHEVRKTANKVLHPQKVKAESIALDKRTFEIINFTIKVIEKLYA